MRQNTIPSDSNNGRQPLRMCFKCKFEDNTALKKCPRCGRPLFSETNVRVRGVLMFFIGLFLSGFMSFIAFSVADLLFKSSINIAVNSQLSQKPYLIVVIYVIFGGVIAGGLSVMFAGIWQVIFGRRNMFLIRTFIALIILTICAGGVFLGMTQ